MQGIILAAGLGSRMKERCADRPKPLLEINHNSILKNLLLRMEQTGIREVIIVVGYQKEVIINEIGHQFQTMNIVYVDNPMYATTNNIYSLYLALQYVKEDCILSEADLDIDQKVLPLLARNGADCEIVVSKFDPETMNGTVIKTADQNKVQQMILREDQIPEETGLYYKTVNIYYFSENFARKLLLDEIGNLVEEKNLQSFYEKAILQIISEGQADVRYICIDEEQWSEVDDEEDFYRAKLKSERRNES